MIPNWSTAIVGEDGTVDPGYLGLFVVMWMILGTIPAAMALVAIHMFVAPGHPLDLVGVAAIIGAAGTAFGAAAVGVGVFRRGDQPHVPVSTSKATLETSSPATPGDPATPLEDAGRGFEPVGKRKGRGGAR